jgi:DNA-binding PadR family transcriptional regulator
MSPVFGHGRLRLYLLKLLDEAPRHGYEIIRLLQDRFLGVYSPSPGTIYPRLARLEEEGLVTHEVVGGKKVYRLTDKGREEVNARLDELADLEKELTESARDIAREVKEDVRETVRNLREELQSATREMRGHTRDTGQEAREAANAAKEEVRRAKQQARQARQSTRASWSASWRQQDWWNGEWQAWVDQWSDWESYPPEAANARKELQRMARDVGRELKRTVDAAGPADLDAVEDARTLFDELLTRLRTDVLDPARGRANPHDD